jgi:DNA-directed RNA polymerase sigma subunit (sigma70/sigma32)
LDSIGQKLSISRERVRQIRDRALRKVKMATQSRGLRAYLD